MEITKAIIQRYQEGHCSEAERKAVENWLQQDETELSFPEEVDLDALQEEAWHAFLQRQDTPLAKNYWRTYRPWAYTGIAAGILLLLSITYFLWPVVSPQVKYNNISVPAGKKMTLTLVDGTRVHLHSGSNFQYPKRFQSKERHVRLQGEAYFDIAKEPGRPFLVETPRSFTRVLGTHFNLRDFPEEKASSIVVEEGKVAYSGKGGTESFVLVAGNRVVWDTRSLKKSEVDVSKYIDWKENVLRFKDIPLAEAIPLIERWYGVQVTLQDTSLAHLHIKVSFRNAPLKKLLDDLAYLTNLNYTIHQNQVTLSR